MAQYDGMVLTNDGINLLAKCQLGQKIEFTKVLIGDGRVPEGKTFQEMTALVNTKLALGIQNVDFVEDGRVDVTAIIDNSGLEVGFFVREIGLFAKQVGGADVLYAYTNAGDLADYLPNAKVNEVTDQIVVQSIITNKENVVININDNFVVATKADLKKHDESVNAHGNLMDAHNADESVHEPAFTAHNEDEGAHENRFSQYVKRSGDVMTAKRAMVRDVNNSNIFICGGKDEFSGAYLQAYGADEENFGGAFVLAANKDTNSSMLKGYPSGELTWGNTLKFSSKHGGYIHREAPTSMWFNGRDYAMLQQKSLPDEGYGALYSLKTNSGSWECGACNYNKDNLIFTFIDDKKYNLASAEEDSGVVPAENNVPKMQFLFGTDGSLKWRDSANGVEKFFVTGINGVNADINGNVDLTPAGTMQMFAGNTIPAGWLLCDGSAVSRTDYAKLFSAIGTIYGKGNNSTTFALPNLIDRVVQGATTAGTYKEAGLPNIEGTFYAGKTSPQATITDGVFYTKNEVSSSAGYASGSNAGSFKTYFNASRSNAIYGNGGTVQPPALTMLPIIKY